MDKKSLAAVITDKRRMELREFAVPTPKLDDAVLKVEACGICGSDYHYYKELDHWPYLNPPHIMGHEVVGRIAAIGADASRDWKLKEGDLVAIEAPVTCQRCRYCLTGNATLCADKRSYGISASMADPPHLWAATRSTCIFIPIRFCTRCRRASRPRRRCSTPVFPTASNGRSACQR